MLLFGKKETNTYVWMVLLKQIQQLNKCLLNTSLFDSYTNFLKSLLQNISSKLGFEIKSDEGILINVINK